MYIFIAVFLTLSGLIHWFLYERLVSALSITNPSLLWTFRALAAFLSVSYVLSRIMEQRWPGAIAHALDWLASVWIGVMFELLWICFLFFLVKVILVISGQWFQIGLENQLLIGRYSFFIVVIAVASLCGFGVWRATQPARLVQVSVPVKNWTPELGELKIISVADFHASNIMTADRVAAYCDQISSLNPDLVLIPGDIVDTPAKQIQDAAPAFRRMKAKYGVFGALGNHEYYVGLQGSIDLIRSGGIQLLINEKTEPFPGLTIAGVEDRTGRQFGHHIPKPKELLGRKESGVTILMNHTPATSDMLDATAAGADLVVCGHTHGGQIWPFRYLTRLAFPFHHGLYPAGDGYVLTTCGIGFWGPPMRIGAPPEIMIVKLIPASQSHSVIWE